MDLLSVITTTAPKGMWESIIFGIEGGVKNYAWALILITLIIKFVLLPFDFINKYSNKKNSRKQAEMQPELEKINKKYANDKNLLNQKTMEVYKAHNYNVMGTCFGMVIYLALTMIVFWTLFSSLNVISNYKITSQFLSVRDAYYTTYGIDLTNDGNEIEYSEPATEGEERPKYTLAYNDYLALSDEEKSSKLDEANANALSKYNESKESFLWIENIWIADSTANPVLSYKDFISKSSLTSEQISEDEYNLIMNPIKATERKNNGCFILVILAAGINYLSMAMPGWISKAKAKKQGIDPNLMGANNKNGKGMQIIMPIIVGVFTFFYNAAFGLYIVAGALIGLVTSPLITVFVDMLEVEAIKREQNRTTAIYDRKRKK